MNRQLKNSLKNMLKNKKIDNSLYMVVVSNCNDLAIIEEELKFWTLALQSVSGVDNISKITDLISTYSIPVFIRGCRKVLKKDKDIKLLWKSVKSRSKTGILGVNPAKFDKFLKMLEDAANTGVIAIKELNDQKTK